MNVKKENEPQGKNLIREESVKVKNENEPQRKKSGASFDIVLSLPPLFAKRIKVS